MTETQTHYLVLAMGSGICAFGASPDLEKAKADCEVGSRGIFIGRTVAGVFETVIPGAFTWDVWGVFDPAGEPANMISQHIFETPALVSDFD